METKIKLGMPIEKIARLPKGKFHFHVAEAKMEMSLTGNLSFITDKNLYKEIRNYIKTEHPNLENKFIFEENVMKQSSTYLAVAVDMFFKKYHPEYRLATQLDLEQNLDFTKDTYNDSGLALRNLKNTNKEQAIYLFNQLKQKNISEKDFPIWINLRGLELTQDLNFNLTEESFYKTAECLNWKSGTNFSKINKFGLPQEENKNFSRQIWTSDNALSSCYLYRDSNLYSDYSDFAYSNGDGRVVLAKLRSN